MLVSVLSMTAAYFITFYRLNSCDCHAALISCMVELRFFFMKIALVTVVLLTAFFAFGHESPGDCIGVVQVWTGGSDFESGGTVVSAVWTMCCHCGGTP